MRRMVEKSSTIRNFMSGAGVLIGATQRGVAIGDGGAIDGRGRRLAAGGGLGLGGFGRVRSSRSSASRFITMMLMRRFAGLCGSLASNSMLEARPCTRSTRSSGRPPATSSRREALARSLESSQLL